MLVTCQGLAGPTCRITLKMTARETVTRGSVTAVSAFRPTVVVGKRMLTLSAGHRQTAHVKLNLTGRRLLAHFHALPATLTISASTSSASARIASQTVWFKG